MRRRCAPRASAVVMAAASGFGSTLLLTACEITQYTQTQQTPEFVVSVTVDPYPSPAGTELDVYATLRQDREGVSGCRVRFAARPAGAEPIVPDETAWVEASEQGRSGVYRTRTVLFKTQGAWELHTGVRCLGRERFVTFNYDVGARTIDG